MTAAFASHGVRAHVRRSVTTQLAFLTLAAVTLAACSAGEITGPGDGVGGSATSPPSSPSMRPNPLVGSSFYLQDNTNARRQADAWRATRPADAAQMDKIATRPQASWFGGWSSDVRASVNAVMTAAASQGALPVLVAYNISRLDCGSGGATPDGYRSWISAFADGIGARRAVVILEPDALAAMGCLSADEQNVRTSLLGYAVAAFKARPGVTLYVDAGHANWLSASEIARRLILAGADRADGFALNVSNFVATAANVAYGEDVSRHLGGLRFVIDTGRNGRGPTADYQWCNPDGRGLGIAPTTDTRAPLVDAFLWIKPPGESDGTCNGGPQGGAWWAEYALGLAQRSI
jgi:endoglucanase